MAYGSALHNRMPSRTTRWKQLEKKLQSIPRQNGTTVFVVTESVFSMDGDQAPLEAMAALCTQYGAALIVDEAHATGVVGERGEGLVQQLGLEQACFARVAHLWKSRGLSWGDDSRQHTIA